MRRIRIAFLLLFLCAQPLAAEAKTYVVGHDPTWPPMEYLDEKEILVGYSIDYIDAVAKAAGFAVTHTEAPWVGIFTRLDQGQYDIVASSVSITEERRKTMDFSDPYFETRQVLVLGAGNEAASIETMPRRILGVQVGTTGQSAANRHPNVTTRLYDEVKDAIQDLAAGKLDGVVCDLPVAQYFVTMVPQHAGRLQIASFSVTDQKEYYGFAVKKGNSSLLRLINTGIAAIQHNKTADALQRKWFPEK